jgi:hypothetical protein
MSEVKLTSFEYSPGGKWSCGSLKLTATTPLGPLVWSEVVPGPRHDEDSAELVVTVDGVEVDLCDNGIELNFEPPGKPGKWADLFSASRDEVEETLQAWFEAVKVKLEALVVAGRSQ